jgi:hypothetical protein
MNDNPAMTGSAPQRSVADQARELLGTAWWTPPWVHLALDIATPMAGELLDAHERLAAVEALHREKRGYLSSTCSHCTQEWPCVTIAALRDLP